MPEIKKKKPSLKSKAVRPSAVPTTANRMLTNYLREKKKDASDSSPVSEAAEKEECAAISGSRMATQGVRMAVSQKKQAKRDAAARFEDTIPSDAEETAAESTSNHELHTRPVSGNTLAHTRKNKNRREMSQPHRASVESVENCRPAPMPKTRSSAKNTFRSGSAAAPQAAKAHDITEIRKQAAAKGTKQARRAAGELGEAAGEAARAAGKAAKELVSKLAIGGGAAALFVLLMLSVAAALFASPAGILFADENRQKGTVTVAEAISQISLEYMEKLESLQAGNYDSVQIIGQPAPWKDVIAVFAVKTAGSDDGTDVITLDDDRIERLRKVFWDMTEIETEISSTTFQGEDGAVHVYRTLTITVMAKTAETMRLAYDFSKYQNSALDFLLENLTVRSLPIGDLEISQEDAVALLENLPDDIPDDRRAVIEAALSLVGKVTYFWGGKSQTIGWDDRWGTPTTVTAAGSGTTGTVRPLGLDCSGFVDWAFFNASGGTYLPGRGGGAASQHSYCTNIAWSEAQPGDLVFYPDDSHVGIVGGRDAEGNLLIIHCSGSHNGVCITGSAGFTQAARVDWF